LFWKSDDTGSDVENVCEDGDDAGNEKEDDEDVEEHCAVAFAWKRTEDSFIETETRNNDGFSTSVIWSLFNK
jgi:hypothetical protein